MRKLFVSALLTGALAAFALAGPAPAVAPSQERARASGLQKVIAHAGGQILACRKKSSSGFIETQWAVRNRRSSDVVKAIVTPRAVNMTGEWEDHFPSYKTGWVNPGVTKRILTESSSDSKWANHETRVKLTSRASDTSRTRTISWSTLPRC